MATANSISPSAARSDALEALYEATAIAKLVQSIAANSPPKEGFHLSGDEAIGLFYTLNNMIDRITLAESLVRGLETATEQ